MLLDLQMPFKNGLQVVKEVKEFYNKLRSKNNKLILIDPHFVFLTAFSTNSLRKHLESMNVKSCYEKPISQ